MTRGRFLSRFQVAGILIGVWVAGCSDRGVTEPRFERPTGTIIGLDQTLRRPANGELGGNAAMAEIARQVGPASIESTDPLIRTVAEWQAAQGVVSGPAATKMWEGVESYDGDYYVWSNGESYAPVQKDARIYNMVAQASRVGGDGPVDVKVTFKFDGHRASNEATWTRSHASGEEIRTRAKGSFGSQTDPFIGMTIFGARGWAASASEEDLGCDVKVAGTSQAKAWYDGTWSENGISIGITPSGPGGSITLTLGRKGEVEVTKGINTLFTCPPPPTSGGGGEYDGGADQCYVCQEWWEQSGSSFIQSWECGPEDPSECSDET